MIKKNECSSTDDYLTKDTVGERNPYTAPIELVDDDPNWVNIYERESKRIKSILGDKVLQLEHGDSASVPGLCAKPMIDILPVVKDSAHELSYIPALESYGYTLRIREPEWYDHHLLKGPDSDINLHVFCKGTSEVSIMLQFSD